MLFTDQHNELRRTVARFVAEEVNPFVDEWEDAGIFPAHELFKKMGDLGLLGISKPEEFGGLGLDYSYEMVLAEELGGINCGGVPMGISVQTNMATPALARFGSDELRHEFLAPAIAGDMGVRSRYPNPTRVLTWRRSRHTRSRTVMTMSSTAPRCGSPTQRSRISCASWPTQATHRHTRTNR